MHRRALATALIATLNAVLLAAGPAQITRAADDVETKQKAANADPFGLTRVLRLDIELSADEYQAMQPPAPAAFGAPRPKKPGGRESERNLFGLEFPWARAH